MRHRLRRRLDRQRNTLTRPARAAKVLKAASTSKGSFRPHPNGGLHDATGSPRLSQVTLATTTVREESTARGGNFLVGEVIESTHRECEVDRHGYSARNIIEAPVSFSADTRRPSKDASYVDGVEPLAKRIRTREPS